MSETIQSLRAQWADGSLSSAQVDDLLTRLASAESRAERGERSLATVDAVLNVVGADDDCRRLMLTSIRDRAERAEAEVARLTAAMPSAEVVSTIKEALDFDAHAAGLRADKAYPWRPAMEWLSRLPAPVDAKGGE